jgi:methionyl aminopeptidase
MNEVEPILTRGVPDFYIAADGWTALTIDGERTAQSEHALLITSDGAQVLT